LAPAILSSTLPALFQKSHRETFYRLALILRGSVIANHHRDRGFTIHA
jgi:hypothetical protein